MKLLLAFLMIFVSVVLYSAPYKVLVYHIKKGDNYYKLSKRFNVSIPILMDWNPHLNPWLLPLGAKLYIPQPSGVVHVVKRGDTLWDISHAYFTDLDALAKVNGIERKNILHIGEKIFIPESLFCSVANRNRPFIWPTYGYITSGFGWRTNPITHRGIEFHRGIDIGAPMGTPIFASRSGIVKLARNNGAYGLCVMIKSGKYVNAYGHLSRIDVVRGEYVRRGQLIGRVGSTGRSTGPHLYFEVWVYGRRYDPLHYLPKTKIMYATDSDNKSVGGAK